MSLFLTDNAPLLFLALLALLIIVGLATLCWRLRGEKEQLEASVAQTVADLARQFDIVVPADEAPAHHLRTGVNRLLDTLERSRAEGAESRRHLLNLFEACELFSSEYTLNGAIGIATETIWQRDSVDFVAVLLGENELGPFHYAGIRGVENPEEVLGQECPVPLWGVLAHTLAQRPESDEPDYLLINDIAAEGRPTREEFAWLPEQGTLMIVPLRSGGKTLGAIVLGSVRPHGFEDPVLLRFLYAVAGEAARTIQDARFRKRSDRWLRQLVSLQLLTKTIIDGQDLPAIMDSLHVEFGDMFEDAGFLVFLKQEYLPGVPGVHLIDSAVLSSPLRALAPGDVDDHTRHLLSVPTLSNLLRWVLEAEQPIFFDPAVPTDDTADLYYRESGRALMVPLGSDASTCLGTLLLYSKHEEILFDESDLLVLRMVGNTAAAAFSKLHMHQLLQTRDRDGAAPPPAPATPRTEPPAPQDRT